MQNKKLEKLISKVIEMKNLIRNLLFMVVMFGVVTTLSKAQVIPVDSDGNGYVEIKTLEHLKWISDNEDTWNMDFELKNDIDASNTKNWNDGKGFNPIGRKDNPFSGIFRGNGFKIINLHLSNDTIFLLLVFLGG